MSWLDRYIFILFQQTVVAKKTQTHTYPHTYKYTNIYVRKQIIYTAIATLLFLLDYVRGFQL